MLNSMLGMSICFQPRTSVVSPRAGQSSNAWHRPGMFHCLRHAAWLVLVVVELAQHARPWIRLCQAGRINGGTQQWLSGPVMSAG